jgi:hypothetical protein
MPAFCASGQRPTSLTLGSSPGLYCTGISGTRTMLPAEKPESQSQPLMRKDSPHTQPFLPRDLLSYGRLLSAPRSRVLFGLVSLSHDSVVYLGGLRQLTCLRRSRWLGFSPCLPLQPDDRWEGPRWERSEHRSPWSSHL